MTLEVKDLCKSYGDVHALNHFNLQLAPGIYGILGPNGAGKSTFMNILTDNLMRDNGRILFDGEDILDMGARYRSLIGYVPQDQICYPQFSGIEFLRYMAKIKGLNIRSTQVRHQIANLLIQVHLSDVAERRIATYSGGMKRRIILAQALLGDPKLLLLDEPTAGLDPAERISIRNLITQLGYDRIVILATHIASDIECIADSVIIMKKGQMIRNEPPHTLIREVSSAVYEIPCTKEEMAKYQKNYPNSHFVQGKNGLAIRIVDREDLYPNIKNAETVTLEDVYMYHFGHES